MPKAKRAELSQEAEDVSTLDTIEAGPSQAPAEPPAKKAKKARKPERSGAEQTYENGILRELVRPRALSSQRDLAFGQHFFRPRRATTRSALFCTQHAR